MTVSPLYGALAGDFVGSVYEWFRIKSKEFPLVSGECKLTDDSIMTLATADKLLDDADDYTKYYHVWGNCFPNAGYGGSFRRWLKTPLEKVKPYGSWGNGSAMRISPVGFACDSEDAVLLEAEKSACVTHDHPEGIKGAQATALAIFRARSGWSKDKIREEIETRFSYDLSKPLEDIRPNYSFDVSCQGSVPVAIRAFLEASSYEDTIRNAVSMGGDSDTLAAIAGGIALAFYRNMPAELVTALEAQLIPDMQDVCNRFARRFPLESIAAR